MFWQFNISFSGHLDKVTGPEVVILSDFYCISHPKFLIQSSRPVLQGEPPPAFGQQVGGQQGVVEEKGSDPRRRH